MQWDASMRMQVFQQASMVEESVKSYKDINVENEILMDVL